MVREAKRRVGSLALALALALACGSALARFEWRDVVQDVRIEANGDVLVSDERTLWTDEDFREAFICVRLNPGQTLTLLEARSLSGHFASFYQQPCDAGQEVVLSHDSRIQEGRVRFLYRLEGILDVYSDVVQWYWHILEREHPPIYGYDLSVTIPGPMAFPFDAYVHRFDNPELPRITLSDDRSQLEVALSRIAGTDGLEVRYLMDPALFALQGSEAGFERLLQDEAQVSGVQAQGRRFAALRSDPMWGVLSLGMVLALAYSIWRAYRRVGREPDPGPTMRYPFEPPSDLPPAAVVLLAAQRAPNYSRAFQATIMDLARRGYGEFGRDGRSFEMHLNLDAPAEALLPFEKRVLEYLKRAAKTGSKASGFLGLSQRPQTELEQAHLAFGELKSYSQQNLQGFMSSWSKALKDWTETRFGGPLTSAESRAAAARHIGAATLATLANVGLQSLALGPARSLFIAGAVACGLLGVVAALALPAWREDLAPEIHGWRGFKRTLSDYTIMRNAPDDFFKLWDYYYVYAAALGVAKRYLRNVERAAPLRGVTESSMVRQGSWLGNHGSLNSLNSLSSSIGSLSSALSAASASASSGGSSSGGGGGGGGGSSGGR